MLNRSVPVIKAKQPFFDWLKSLPDPGNITLEKVNADTTVYLLSELWSDDDRNETIKTFYDLIFEDQLSGWWTEKENWPPNRDFETFTQWFDVKLHSIVRDLVDAPLEDDDLVV